MLKYTASGNGMFYLPYNTSYRTTLKYRKVEGAGSFTFKDWFPRNMLCLTEYFKNETLPNKADPAALTRIKEIKAEQKVYEECDSSKEALYDTYKHLFKYKPFNHQLSIINKLILVERDALLLEQGLGKTYISLMTIRLLKEMGKPHKAIVVCPLIVFYSWQHEAEKYVPDLKVVTYRGDFEERCSKRRILIKGDWDILITTYEMLGIRPQPMSPKGIKLPLMMKDREQYEEKIQEVKKALDIKRETAANLRKIAEQVISNKVIDTLRIEDNTGLFLSMLDAGVLVFDEASRLINHSSIRAQIAECLSEKIRRCYLLSGTICLGRPTDLYMPMNILDRDILGMTWTQFENEYCQHKNRYNKHIITGYKNIQQIKIKSDPYIHSLERNQCLDLPPRIIENEYYRLPDNLVYLYNTVGSPYIKRYKNGDTEIDNTVYLSNIFDGMSNLVLPLYIQRLNKAMQVLSGFINVGEIGDKCGEFCEPGQIRDCICNHISYGQKQCKYYDKSLCNKNCVVTHSLIKIPPKISHLADMLDDLIAKEKVIIWAWFKYDIKSIKDFLEASEIKYITPETPDSAAIFEASDDIRVYLGQTAQGIGITLNSATTTIYYSHGTALEPRLQSMDRNMRIGQGKAVVVKDMLCAHTIEQEIVTLLQHKKDVQQIMQRPFVKCNGCILYSQCRGDKITEKLEKEDPDGVLKARIHCPYIKDICVAEGKERLGLFPLMDSTGRYCRYDKDGKLLTMCTESEE